MMVVGFGRLFFLLIILIIWLLPIILGFTVVRADADQHSQPGWLWALLTIPFGWLTLLIYAAVRAASGSTRA